MNLRLPWMLGLCAAVMLAHGQPATAQADAHARALARASCQSGKHSDAVMDATAAVQKDPEQLGPHMRLADALVDQGCYQEAVETLEAVQASYPRSSELSAKLRDVRSLVTEQTYIEGLTQAAEGAKFARNQLRCTRLADITACEDALKSKPDEVVLLLALGEALVQANRPAEAVLAYRHASQLKPGDESVRGKLSTAEALQAKSQPVAPASAPAPVVASAAASGPRTAKAPARKPPTVVAAAGPGASPGRMVASAALGQPNGGQHLTTTPTPAVAALAAPESKTYSNDAPAGQTN